MRPVYFPHTFMSASAAAAIRAWFPSVVSYQPFSGRLPESMRSLVQTGFLEVVAPDPAAEDPQRCEALIGELEQWGWRHHAGAGLQPVHRRARQWSDPFRSDGLSSELTAAIRRRAASTPAVTADPLATARVFLHFAQAFDVQTHQAEESLERFKSLNALLFETLAGEAGPVPAEAGFIQSRAFDDSGDYLLERRIESWVRLFLSRPYPSPVYITRHPAVMECLLDQFPQTLRLSLADVPREAIDRQSATPSAKGNLISHLVHLTCQAVPVTMPELNAASSGFRNHAAARPPILHLVPDRSPGELFSKLLPGGAAFDVSSGHDPWHHTVIVQVV